MVYYYKHCVYKHNNLPVVCLLQFRQPFLTKNLSRIMVFFFWLIYVVAFQEKIYMSWYWLDYSSSYYDITRFQFQLLWHNTSFNISLYHLFNFSFSFIYFYSILFISVSSATLIFLFSYPFLSLFFLLPDIVSSL